MTRTVRPRPSYSALLTRPIGSVVVTASPAGLRVELLVLPAGVVTEVRLPASSQVNLVVRFWGVGWRSTVVAVRARPSSS